METCSVARIYPILSRSLHWTQNSGRLYCSSMDVDLRERVDQLGNASLTESIIQDEKDMNIYSVIGIAIWIRSSYDPSIQNRLKPIVLLIGHC